MCSSHLPLNCVFKPPTWTGIIMCDPMLHLYEESCDSPRHPMELHAELAREAAAHCLEQDRWNGVAAKFELLVMHASDKMNDGKESATETLSACFSAATMLAQAYGKIASHERRLSVFMKHSKAAAFALDLDQKARERCH